ncbi:hypothetical protein [Burkholderia ubonensis]|uniref:hypothetical protein n=1 Tax=Burkholderia ubonensis TaxID=101571 RepID=UPI000754DD2F|nr:hypothetical protein [Burkholderia ubonensis]KVU66283.1 hypothetical protein WK71_18950 [Burkholderia ubonensis]
MSMFVTVLMVIFFVAAGAIIILNLAYRPDSLVDFWSLDNEYERKPSRLDFLRTKFAFYASVAVVLVIGLLHIFVLR